MFYWLDKYPARGASVLPLPPLSVLLPLFFLSLISSYPFFVFETLLCFVVFLLSFIQKGKKAKTKSKKEDNNFSTFFRPALFLPFLSLFFSSSERGKDVNKVLSSFASFLIFFLFSFKKDLPQNSLRVRMSPNCHFKVRSNPDTAPLLFQRNLYRYIRGSYQRNKQNFIYRNGCAKEISKKIKDGKNKK